MAGLSLSSALSLSMSPRAGGGGGALIIPTNAWRLQVTDTYDSLGANAAFNTSMLAQHTAKNRVGITPGGVASATTRHIAFKVAAVAAPGGMFSFRPSYASDVNQIFTVHESTDSVDGSEASGTWTTNAFAMQGISEAPGSQGKGNNRAQIVQLAEGPARWVRLKIDNTNAASCSVSEFRVHQFQADGSQDLWAVIGMSITRTNLTTSVAEALMKAIKPGADPLVLDMARSGANATQIKDEMIIPITTNPQFNGVVNVLFDNGPNDTAYAGIRPWTGKASDIAVGTRFRENLGLLNAKFGQSHVYASNISFGNFLTGDGQAGASPYVNNALNSANGMLPYNQNYIDPAIKELSPTSWDSTYDTPVINDYWGMGLSLVPQTWPNDPLHGGNPAWNQRREFLIRKAYGIASAQTTVSMIRALVGAKNASDKKASYQTLVTSCFMPGESAGATINRAALVAEAAAIVTTFSDPTLSGGAILLSGITTGTRAFHVDAGQFELITRKFDNEVVSMVDRSANAYAISTPNANSRPISRPEQFGGDVAAINFKYKYGNHLLSSNTTLRAMLDGANSAWTLFFVVTVQNGAVAGYGSNLFSIGGVTNPRVRIGIGFRPTLNTADGTGTSAFSPADAAIVAGVRYACMLRCDSAGVLTYRRGSEVVTGSTARLAAITSTLNTRIGTHGNGDTNATFQDDLHELALFAGAVSDAEAALALDGLRQKWTDSEKVCV